LQIEVAVLNAAGACFQIDTKAQSATSGTNLCFDFEKENPHRSIELAPVIQLTALPGGFIKMSTPRIGLFDAILGRISRSLLGFPMFCQASD
jgi:hypothetical protein